MRFILLFLLFFNQNLHSQKQFEKDNELTISGIVITENNKPLEYATVTIIDSESSDIITGGLTDKNGQFSISAASGVYHINDLSILSGNKNYSCKFETLVSHCVVISLGDRSHITLRTFPPCVYSYIAEEGSW